MEFDFPEVTDLSQVPEQVRPLYNQQASAEGKYSVNQAFGSVTEVVKGLNKSLKASRAEAKGKNPTDLTKLADFGATPDEIRTSIDKKLQELQDQIKNTPDAKTQVDRVRTEMGDKHNKEMEKATKRAEGLLAQLNSLLIDRDAVTAVAEAKGNTELLMPFLRQQVRTIEEGGAFKVVVIDGQGETRYGATGAPMTIKELVAEMKGKPNFGPLFESEVQGGGGGSGTPPGGGRQGPATGQDRSQMSATDRISAGLKKKMGRR